MTRDFLAFEVSRLLSIYAHEQFCVTIKKEFYMVSIYVCHVLVLLRKLYRIKKLPFAVNMLFYLFKIGVYAKCKKLNRSQMIISLPE